MKKQFFTLVMMLAIIVFAGSSAMAQNSATAPEIMFGGSSRTFSVTDNSGDDAHTYLWEIFTCTGSGTGASPYLATTTAAVAGATGAYTTTGNTSYSFPVSWTQYAAGGYCVRVTESNPTTRESCPTVRQFFVSVVDFDLHIFASSSAGSEYTADADLFVCGANADYNPWSNAERADLSTLQDAHTSFSSKSATYSSRYVTATISATGIAFGSSPYKWNFPYEITGGDDNYDIGIYCSNTNVTITPTDYNSGTVTVGLDEGNTITTITLEIRYEPKWANAAAADIQLALDVAQSTCKLDGSDTDDLFDDGTELSTNYDNTYSNVKPMSNTSRNQIIYASPATSVIGISAN